MPRRIICSLECNLATEKAMLEKKIKRVINNEDILLQGSLVFFNFSFEKT